MDLLFFVGCAILELFLETVPKIKGSDEAFRIERSDAEGDKMKESKAMFSAVLAVATVVSLAACGTANNSGNATTKDGKRLSRFKPLIILAMVSPPMSAQVLTCGASTKSCIRTSKSKRLSPRVPMRRVRLSTRPSLPVLTPTTSMLPTLSGCHQCLRSLIPSWI